MRPDIASVYARQRGPARTHDLGLWSHFVKPADTVDTSATVQTPGNPQLHLIILPSANVLG